MCLSYKYRVLASLTPYLLDHISHFISVLTLKLMKSVPMIFILMVISSIDFGLPMKNNQAKISTSPSLPSSSKATKGVENMSEMKYKCVQGMLHCKIFANKLNIQLEKLPGRFHAEPVSEHQITTNNVNVLKKKIESHQGTIKENRLLREKNKINSADPDEYQKHGLSP